MLVPIKEIEIHDDFNCRGVIAPIDVIGLAQSIEKQGLISPVVVSEINPPRNGFKFKLIAGFRRTKAHELLKRTEIDVVIKPAMSDIAARVLNLSENLDRKNLNILQEAKALEVLNGLGLKRQEMADYLNMSTGWVQVRLMLLDLPEDLQQEAAAGILGQHNIRDLYALRHNKNEMYEAYRVFKERKEKGERTPVKIRPKDENVLKRRRRDPGEIYKLICHLLDNLGESLTTRVLAWVNGDVTDYEIYLAIKKEMQLQNKLYNIPPVSIANLEEQKVFV